MPLSFQNIVELKVYDEDSFIGNDDDLCSTVVFDINNLIPGKKETKTFICEPVGHVLALRNITRICN